MKSKWLMNDKIDGKNSHAWTPESHNFTTKYIKCMLQRVLAVCSTLTFPLSQNAQRKEGRKERKINKKKSACSSLPCRDVTLSSGWWNVNRSHWARSLGKAFKSGRELLLPLPFFPLFAVLSAHVMAGAPAASSDHEESLRMEAMNKVWQSRRNLDLWWWRTNYICSRLPASTSFLYLK